LATNHCNSVQPNIFGYTNRCNKKLFWAIHTGTRTPYKFILVFEADILVSILTCWLGTLFQRAARVVQQFRMEIAVSFGGASTATNSSNHEGCDVHRRLAAHFSAGFQQHQQQSFSYL
jgi:hypothetical protein